MVELNRRHYLLRKTLDELELIPDWYDLRLDLINLVLRDMSVKDEREGKYINFGYEHRPGKIPDKLMDDLQFIREYRNDDFFDEPLNPRIKEMLEGYKNSDSFIKISTDEKERQEREVSLEDVEEELNSHLNPYKN